MVQIVSEPVSCDFIELVKLVVFVAVFYTRRAKLFCVICQFETLLTIDERNIYTNRLIGFTLATPIPYNRALIGTPARSNYAN